MNIWASRSLLPLIGAVSAAILLGCEGASAVAVTTGPTPAAKCHPALAAPSNVGAAGGLSAVSVLTQPECAWSASTEVGWITELSPRTGQGSGQLGFRAAPNTGPATREGTIVVNDDRVRIVQEAAPIPPAAPVPPAPPAPPPSSPVPPPSSPVPPPASPAPAPSPPPPASPSPPASPAPPASPTPPAPPSPPDGSAGPGDTPAGPGNSGPGRGGGNGNEKDKDKDKDKDKGKKKSESA